jgi:hypothetical protein
MIGACSQDPLPIVPVGQPGEKIDLSSSRQGGAAVACMIACPQMPGPGRRRRRRYDSDPMLMIGGLVESGTFSFRTEEAVQQIPAKRTQSIASHPSRFDSQPMFLQGVGPWDVASGKDRLQVNIIN